MCGSNSDENESINAFDDVVIKTTGDHGGDISSQRFDILDRKSLKYVINKDKDVTAVDIGCGLAAQGLRFSLVGSDVTLIDIMDLSNRVSVLNNLFEMVQMDFLNKDVRNISLNDLPMNIDLIYSQRFIHYLTFNEAKEAIKMVSERVKPGGRIYISASGLQTELGEGYPDNNELPENRYSCLKPSVAEKHDIHNQVCLYEKEDMNELLSVAGFEPIDVFASEFGNIKGIGRKK